jgi:ubiquinone/menaquinone biosynthesis C-methylase UbiE
MTPLQEQIFSEIHRDNPREGPGSFESTQKAYSVLRNLPDHPCILDIGCGPGKQTLDLAKISPGSIYAIDTHEYYLKQLQQKIHDVDLSQRIFAITCDMRSLAFEREYFDVIWAEGSLYVMGFEAGLIGWKPYLKPNGYLAVTELTWLKPDPPQVVEQYWRTGYPAMKTKEENLALIRKANYTLIEYFVLPDNAWWDDYYCPLEEKVAGLKIKYTTDPEALEVLQAEEQEMEMHRRYSEYYGYVFYIMQKP